MSESSEPAPDAVQSQSPPPPAPPTPPIPAAPGGAGVRRTRLRPRVGTIRSTGTCVLLTIVTLGFYTWYWYYKTHDEMKQHSGTGIGGGVALILAIFVGIAMPFLTSHEVGGLYERRGQARPGQRCRPVCGHCCSGWFFFVGLIVWFVKTNGALNAYWRSARRPGLMRRPAV